MVLWALSTLYALGDVTACFHTCTLLTLPNSVRLSSTPSTSPLVVFLPDPPEPPQGAVPAGMTAVGSLRGLGSAPTALPWINVGGFRPSDPASLP